MSESAFNRYPDPESMPYPEPAQQPDYPALEEEILDWWDSDRTFDASVEARPSGDNDFVFYDGPPFANGLPHYGHLLTGFVKDAVPRYQTMRGRRVERRFGWDCHGLPAEMAVEKELGLSGRAAIEEFGIDRFNDHCRQLVQRTTGAWEQYVRRQARWVDIQNSYKTMDLSYMESVMWAFKELWKKGLVYEGDRILPYCWECETPLSNFETRQDDSYRDREDPAVTVGFELTALQGGFQTRAPEGAEGEMASGSTDQGGLASGGATKDQIEVEDGDHLRDALTGPVRILVWTTTPWTLPSNLALAVGEDIVYDVLDVAGTTTVIAQERVVAYQDQLGDALLLGHVKGSSLVGRSYRPLYDFFTDHDGAFRVLAADFVTTSDGTGVVHIAPGFGEDDHALCRQAGIETICPVDDQARFTHEVTRYAGMQVFDANKSIIADLKANGSLVKRERYVHSYPHCWRSDTPLIYKSMSSWFVEVTAVKDQMVTLNQDIEWVPGHIRDGAFGKWLEGARDWSISRNRFWGAPIPVWKSDDPAYPRVDVYSGLEELERDFGARPEDLHRPTIDTLTRPNPDDPTGRSTMRRVPDVLDCWFESGAMPFAQIHYPFERYDWFESHFPADFIVEYIGQTRGWFYTLHVLATAIFAKPPFRHCIAHGIVLGDDGRKMSKRLGNYPEPDMVFSRWGADAMRWFLLSSPILRGQDLVVHTRGIEDSVRSALNPIWNAWYFLCLYGNADGMKGKFNTSQTGVLDRYILAKTSDLVAGMTQAMDAYDLYKACHLVTDFIDALNNWYIRRSRPRFWDRVDDTRPSNTTTADPAVDRLGTAYEDPDPVGGSKQEAYDTLSTVLSVLCTVSAPLLPLLTEAVFKGLTGRRSVHLEDWPQEDLLPSDPPLVQSMDLVRAVCSAGHAIRKANGRRARLPLPVLTVAASDAELLAPFADLIAEELNVKEVRLISDVDQIADRVLVVVPAALGPRLGPRTQAVIGAVKRGEWSLADNGDILVEGETLVQGEFELILRPKEPEIGRTLPREAGVVALDIETTSDLELEGTANDLVRSVQQERRAAGLHVSDRIRLTLQLDDDMTRAAQMFEQYIAEQTLADFVEIFSSESMSISVEKV